MKLKASKPRDVHHLEIFLCVKHHYKLANRLMYIVKICRNQLSFTVGQRSRVQEANEPTLILS